MSPLDLSVVVQVSASDPFRMLSDYFYIFEGPQCTVQSLQDQQEETGASC